MSDWSDEVEARLRKVLDESAEVVNILPDRTTQWDISADIRAALGEIGRLTAERDEWKRLAHVEAKGVRCAFEERAKEAEEACSRQELELHTLRAKLAEAQEHKERYFRAGLEAQAEVERLRERWACVECGRTPDGGRSGDLYVSICYGCHRCMACAEPMCTICGDAEGTRMRAGDLLAEVERLEGLILDWHNSICEHDRFDVMVIMDEALRIRALRGGGE